MMDKVAAAVTESLDAVLLEIRETGEMGELLAKAAAGRKLDAHEWGKVKAQLVDLAKVVPALAIFAAPGGMFLLPVLAKLLPFDLLPSAWKNGRHPSATGSTTGCGRLSPVLGGAPSAPIVSPILLIRPVLEGEPGSPRGDAPARPGFPRA